MIVKLFFFIFPFFNLISGLSQSVQLNLDYLGLCSFSYGTSELFEISNETNLEKNGEYKLSLNPGVKEGNLLSIQISFSNRSLS